MLALLLALLLGEPAPPPPAQAFGETVEIEVRGLPSASVPNALRKALAEIADVERLAPADALAQKAGQGPQEAEERLLTLLGRARDFCLWSEGANGPLGKELYTLWADPSEPPSPQDAETAAGRAACGRLAIDPSQKKVSLAPGSGIDLRSFAPGFAVDRAIEILRKEGATSAFVRIGSVQRGVGEGPGGKGWPVEIPSFAENEPPDRIYLRNRSLAVASQGIFLNQRTGRRAHGVVATAAVTELAVDAQGVAVTVLITGAREGQLRLGSLRPRPSVRWFLGSGAGSPLRVDYRWSEVSRN